jgi:hypothetical protein
MTTTGDTIYSSSGSTPARLPIGSTGNVLTVAGGVPTWAAPAGGGKVLQVVYGSSATDTSNATATYADTTLTASITPTLNTSKVLVLVNQNGVGKTTNNTYIELKLLRGATDLINLDLISGNTNTNAINFIGSISTSYLDEPATTSSTTYKTQFRSGAGNSQVSVQGASSRSTIVLLEIGA